MKDAPKRWETYFAGAGSKGFRSIMVCYLEGPTETTYMGTPESSSIRRR